MGQTKKVYLETYGCQMNEYDSELIRTILVKQNYEFVALEQQADVVMLNTCSVRDNANRKVFNRIHQVKNNPNRNGKDVKVGILGCMATNFRKKLLDNPALKIDFIAGPDSYKELPTMLSDISETGEKSFHVTLSEFETYSDIYPSRQEGVNAWIAIMRGCNNYCTFCVVPHTRGRERSREPQNIVEEVKRLVSEGFKQVTLLGQNVNSYRYEESDFTDLMARVSDVSGLERIRFTSPHPKDFPTKLIKLMSERDNICKQIHMPLQAGSSRVLESMNRTYTKEAFYEIVAQTREIIPNIAISTDIIVGFPTETEAEFEETYEVMSRVRFDSAFIFKYSERPNTLASKRMKDDVPEAEKTRRIVALNELQMKISLEKNQSLIGQQLPILIEKKGAKKDPDSWVGRTDSNRLVILEKGEFAIGQTITAEITDASPQALRGRAQT